MPSKSEAIVKQNMDYNLFTWTVQSETKPIAIDHGRGIYMYDADGKEYMDFCSDQVCCNIGKSHPKVNEAMKAQIDKISFGGPQYASKVKGVLAEKIVSKLLDNFGKILFTNAGADAVENALKIARAYTGRQKVISCYRSYHGCTAGSGAVTGDHRRWAVEPGVPGCIKAFNHYCYRCSFGKEPDSCGLECATHIDEIVQCENPGAVAAIIVETVTGGNGILPPPDGYLSTLREICDKHGILLILDEVMAGFGRTGKFFAFEHYGVKPDIVVMAKGLTSGYVQLGAVAYSKEICDYYQDRFLSTGLTYSGHVLGCATGIAVMDVIDDEGLVENSRVMGAYLAERLQQMQEKHPCVGEARGIGLMQALELVADRGTREKLSPEAMGKLKAHMLDNGVFLGFQPNLAVIAPPLIVKKEELDKVLELLDEGLSLADQYVHARQAVNH